MQNTEPLLIGSAAFLAKCRQMAESMQLSTNPLLISGESGVGKTLLAHFLCLHSAINKKALRTIWLDEIAENLLEQELFGYCDGKVGEYEGMIKHCDEGTVILKGIACFPMQLQAKLLRLIETGEYERIGDGRPVQANVRIICTTKENLRQLVIENKFRKDLYYILSANEIILQPLRNRPDDIKVLSQSTMSEIAKLQKKSLHGITTNALRVLQSYSWPGNVRELKAEIEHAVSSVNSGQQTLKTKDLSPKVRFNFSQLGVPDKTKLFDKVKLIERQLIIEAIEKNGGNKSIAARALGIKHRTLYQKMKSLGIPLDLSDSLKT